MRLSFRLMFAAAVALGAFHGGCSSQAPAPALDPALADVVFQGAATGPALDALLKATPQADPVRGPTITSPPDQTLLKADQPFTFTWKPGGAAALAPSLLPALPAERSAAASLTLLGFGERSAWAAPAPLVGTGYFLLFSTTKTPSLLRVFTTGTSYTPDAKAWATLVGAAMWTKLIVASAAFMDDRLVAGSGPFTGATIEFCIED
jgi:hypothetical protein